MYHYQNRQTVSEAISEQASWEILGQFTDEELEYLGFDVEPVHIDTTPAEYVVDVNMFI